MGLSLSLLLSAWNEILEYNIFNSIGTIIGVKSNIGELVLRTSSFRKEDSETMSKSKESDKVPKPEKLRLRTSTPLNDLVLDNTITNPVSPNTKKRELVHKSKPDISLPEQFVFSSPRPISELDDAATKLQKVYKSYRTRRNLADCAVVVEELWWKALDFAALKQSSVSFFDIKKPETAASRWARATTRLAKVGKGLSKDEKAQKLALQHWLEAIDPRHRYGHNLHLYYDLWSSSKSSQPFFYWLDVGDGKELNHGSCSRIKLQHQCIQYLGPKEREEYEVIVENGKLVYKQNEMLLDTLEGSKWIFVLSTSRKFYVGQKNKGSFQHSSFLSGAATTAAGRLVAHNGILEAIWPYSGHYLPTEDNFNEFIIFLEENQLDLTNVKRCATDDDRTSFKVNDEDPMPEMEKDISATALSIDKDVANANEAVNDLSNTAANQEDKSTSNAANIEVPMFDSTRPLSCKWTSGVGPRIGCVRDYPANLQSQALEQMHLSPRVTFGRSRSYLPIPSPRPSPKIWVSPRLAYMGLPSPRVTISTQLKF